MYVSLLIHFYAWLLRLYPSSFREELGEEMTAVFSQAMMEAREQGWLSVAAVCLRECRDLPLSLVREHWHSLTAGELSMTTIYKKPDWYFYLAWIVLTTLCVPIALSFALIILKVITSIAGDIIYVDGIRRITEDYLISYTLYPLVCLWTGVLQYGLLCRYLPRMGWWVLATVAGWLLGSLVILLFSWLNFQVPEVIEVYLALIVLGLSIGVSQWLLLRRRLPRAGWWIGANVVAWGLLGLIAGGSLRQFSLMALGFVPACMTAITLATLINQAVPPEPHGI